MIGDASVAQTGARGAGEDYEGTDQGGASHCPPHPTQQRAERDHCLRAPRCRKSGKRSSTHRWRRPGPQTNRVRATEPPRTPRNSRCTCNSTICNRTIVALQLATTDTLSATRLPCRCKPPSQLQSRPNLCDIVIQVGVQIPGIFSRLEIGGV